MSATVADQDEDDAPEAVLAAAYETYTDSGLRLPPVPRELVGALEEQADWLYATEPCDVSDREEFMEAARAEGAKPRVAFGHTGHGQASWYLCYQLIRGPLRVFVRQRYGSPYDDEELARASVNRVTEGVEELVVHADAAQESGRLAKGQRLLVAVDEMDGSGFEILGSGEGWQGDEFPIGAALQRIGTA